MHLTDETRELMRLAGALTILTCWWNGVGDWIYGVSYKHGGARYLRGVGEVVVTCGGRPHWKTCIAQTAGWFYPLWCFGAWQIYMGLRPAGECYALPYLVLWSYALCILGGAQHSGWAWLTVVQQAKAAAGCTDARFLRTVQRYCQEHFVVGDLPAPVLLLAASAWQLAAVATGKTLFPMWFIAVNPLFLTAYSMLLTIVLPCPVGSAFGALFGTWVVLVPQVVSTILLWDTPTVGSSHEQHLDVAAYVTTGLVCFLVLLVFLVSGWAYWIESRECSALEELSDETESESAEEE